MQSLEHLGRLCRRQLRVKDPEIRFLFLLQVQHDEHVQPVKDHPQAVLFLGVEFQAPQLVAKQAERVGQAANLRVVSLMVSVAPSQASAASTAGYSAASAACACTSRCSTRNEWQLDTRQARSL